MSIANPEAEHDVVGRHGRLGLEVFPHDFNPNVTDAEFHIYIQERMEVEGRVKYGEFMLGALEEENPGDAEALAEWLEEDEKNLRELVVAGVVEIDDEALAEAELLDDIIAALYEDNAPMKFIKLVEVRKELKLARRELREFQARYPQVA